MAYYCDIEYEDAALDDVVFTTIGSPLGESATLSTLAVESAATTAEEYAVLDDLATQSLVSLAYETAQVFEVDLSTLRIVEVLVDEARTGSSSVWVAASYAFETAELGDAVALVFRNNTVEAALLDDSAPDVRIKLNSATETARIRGVADSGYVDIVDDDALLSGVALPPALSMSVTDTAVLGSFLLAEVAQSNIAVDDALLSDYTENTLLGSNTSAEAAFVSGYLVVVGKRTAYAADLGVLGMSRYDDLSARQFVRIGKTWLSLGEDNVFTLSKATAPRGFVLTGKLDFDSDAMKRVPYVYASGELQSSMQVTAFVDEDGEDASYEYPFEARTGESTRTNRAVLGKGLRSRYWQFQIENTDTLPFSIRSATAEAAPLSRRV